MQDKRVLIIGEVYIDHHIDIPFEEGYLSRLGGVFHAARACDALGLEYAIAYFAPAYLEKDIQKFSEILKAKKAYCLGVIDRAPNIMLIGKSDESGSQLYDNILCKQAVFIEKKEIKEILFEFSPTDVVLFPGRYDNKKFVNELSNYTGKIHIDMNYDCDDIKELRGISIETVFLSTSSIAYKDYFEESSYEQLVTCFKEKNVGHLVIKENRGGSWAYEFASNRSYEAPAYNVDAIHSVGVGDVYNMAYLRVADSMDIEKRMIFASWIAAAYAQTFDHQKYKENTELICEKREEFLQIKGVRVPWTKRQCYQIYMAAPDFNYVDTKKLDELVNALTYHNFVPRLPIRENGQVNVDSSLDEEYQIFAKDIELLQECKLMIATLLYNDQGTLVEIGNYHAEKKPIILYDPYKKLNNMFLKNVCTSYCQTVSEVIDAIFNIISGMVNDGE